jgi:hypothetical protein
MTRSKLFRQVPRTLGSVFGLALGAVLLVFCMTLASTSAVAQFATPTQLTFVNGWVDAGFTTSHAMVEEANGLIEFRGSIEAGTTAVAFTLPAGYRPSTNVYIPVDLCNAAKGRLFIQPSGVVSVQAEKLFTDAQCFTSLDGAMFSVNATGYTALTLVNGWTNAPFGTSNAAFRNIAGGIHFKGAIATTGTNPVAFTMPAGVRPLTDVYIPVDLCNATNGRLHITPSGVADIEAEGGTFSNAQCFTSLDGAYYIPSGAGFTALTLINGWTNAPFATSNAAAANAFGGVYFKGAIATAGTIAQPFLLPPRFRPVTNVYVNVDLCNATKGRLFIQTNGAVTVQAEGGTFSNAQCFTSLDGVSFTQ